MLREAMHMDGSADTYGDFMWTEGYIAMVILAFAASVIVGNDFQHNSLPFYLSKPIGRRHYLMGKALAVAVVINAMTTVPASACSSNTASSIRGTTTSIRFASWAASWPTGRR